MGKDTNFIGQPVYVQLLNLVDRERIRKISLRGGHDRYVKKLDGYTHFVAFLFAILSDSILKPWEKQLDILDSTTITLFSTILKGAGRNPKHGCNSPTGQLELPFS